MLSGAATADLKAQNQLEIAPQAAPAVSDEPEIRFIPGEVVQPTPAPASSDTLSEGGSLGDIVQAIDASSEPTGEQLCLAQAVYFEARGEPLAGQLAVAQVVINRAQSGRFADSYCGVVTQPAQFSFVRGGRIPAANIHSSAWQRAKAIAQIADEGLWRSEVGDALYFHANHVSPSWARARTTRATIERHVFYR
jgi:spore germination cell wall hydrolase CwlJ-like protein